MTARIAENAPHNRAQRVGDLVVFDAAVPTGLPNIGAFARRMITR